MTTDDRSTSAGACRRCVLWCAVVLAVLLVHGRAAAGQRQDVPEWPDDAELEVHRLTPTGLELRWPVATGADEYEIFQSSDECERDEREVDCVPLQTLSRRNVSTFVTDLDPGTTFAFWVTACNGGGCTDSRSAPSKLVTTPLPVGFDLQTPGALEVVRGDFSIVDVSVEVDRAVNEAPETVALTVSGLPSIGADAELDPDEGSPPFVARLRISTSGNTPLGTYPVSLLAAGGSVTREATIDVSVVDAAGGGTDDGDVITAPALVVEALDGVEVVQGDLSTVEVSVSVDPPQRPSPGPVALQVSGVPGLGAEARFVPPDGVPPFVSRLHLSASENTGIGTYPLTVLAVGGESRGSATIDMAVVAGPGTGDWDIAGVSREVVVGVATALIVAGITAAAAWLWRRRSRAA